MLRREDTGSNLEIILDGGYDVRIVISDHDADREPIFGVPTGRPCEDNERAFTVEKSDEPLTEFRGSNRAIRNAVTGNPIAKRLPDVYLVNDAVSFRDSLDAGTGHCGNFRVTKASPQELSLFSEDGRINLSTSLVGHLSFSNRFGSLVRYAELYAQAIRKSNATGPKQELGIPDMLKRALMEDGWYLRSDIIWHKPNPMPESVTDRPTKSHEYLFLLSKSERYYFDADAVRSETPNRWAIVGSRRKPKNRRRKIPGSPPAGCPLMRRLYRPGEHPLRLDDPGAAVQGRPLATFPPKLVIPCIKAGTSERGCCPECGKPWKRVSKRTADRSSITLKYAVMEWYQRKDDPIKWKAPRR